MNCLSTWVRSTELTDSCGIMTVKYTFTIKNTINQVSSVFTAEEKTHAGRRAPAKTVISDKSAAVSAIPIVVPIKHKLLQPSS